MLGGRIPAAIAVATWAAPLAAARRKITMAETDMINWVQREAEAQPRKHADVRPLVRRLFSKLMWKP